MELIFSIAKNEESMHSNPAITTTNTSIDAAAAKCQVNESN